MSGLNQRFTKPSAGKTAREFESHILRIDNLLVSCPDCLSSQCDPQTSGCMNKKQKRAEWIALFCFVSYSSSSVIFLSFNTSLDRRCPMSSRFSSGVPSRSTYLAYSLVAISSSSICIFGFPLVASRCR